MDDNKALVRAEFRVLETGEVDLAKAIAHPEWLNLESAPEPRACAARGPGGMLAVGAWLRFSFSELSFQVHDQIQQTDQVWSYVTMSGLHNGPWVVFPPKADPRVFAPTNKAFAVRQVHLHKIQDGLIVEHGAVRDDLSMLGQLGLLRDAPQEDAQTVSDVEAVTAAALRL